MKVTPGNYDATVKLLNLQLSSTLGPLTATRTLKIRQGNLSAPPIATYTFSTSSFSGLTQ